MRTEGDLETSLSVLVMTNSKGEVERYLFCRERRDCSSRQQKHH